MNKLQLAEQFRKALQLFAESLGDEQAMEIASVYDKWEIGVEYDTNKIIIFGINNVGDPQLYRVLNKHKSQADWIPSQTPSLYKPIGLTPSGYPIWSRPTGAADAYNIGDIVSYNDVLKISLIDGNVWSPDEYPQGWDNYIEPNN